MTSTPLFTLDELALLRGWLNGLPLAALNEYCSGDASPSQVFAALRTRLRLKARRLQLTVDEHWLERPQDVRGLQSTLAYVNQLQQQPDLTPSLEQPLSYWLDDEALAKLAVVHVKTIADWQHFVHNQAQRAWWQAIPGLGKTTALMVEQQLEALLPGLLIKPQQPTSAVLYETNIVPIEHLCLPETLDGRSGTNRSPQPPFIPAQDDYQAILAWLSRFDPASHTARSYRREAERLLLWAVIEKQQPVSSLTVVDLAEYREFLANPTPRLRWVGVSQPKTKANWKPFTGSLSPRSRSYAETVLNNLFNFLVSQHYLLHNPISALPKLKTSLGQRPLDVNRAFNDEHWQLLSQFVEDTIARVDAHEQLKWLRNRLLLQLGFNLGLRLHELAQAKLADLQIIQRSDHTQYWITVIGKGQKQRQVPIPLTTYLLLVETYLALTGYSLRRPGGDYPLIPPLRGSEKTPLTPLAIHKVLKECFSLAADALTEQHPDAADKLRKASTHWLRHSHGSAAAERNIPLVMIRDNLGHSSIATTSHYLHADQDARHEAFANGFAGAIK